MGDDTAMIHGDELASMASEKPRQLALKSCFFLLQFSQLVPHGDMCFRRRF